MPAVRVLDTDLLAGSSMRTFLHILILPFLTVALTVGSQSSMCDALSVFGVDPHHHEGATSICTCPDDLQDQERTPCPDECESKLTEAANPSLLKTPQPEFSLLSQVNEIRTSPRVSVNDQNRPAARIEPPDLSRITVSPTFTGRFLI